MKAIGLATSLAFTLLPHSTTSDNEVFLEVVGGGSGLLVHRTLNKEPRPNRWGSLYADNLSITCENDHKSSSVLHRRHRCCSLMFIFDHDSGSWQSDSCDIALFGFRS